MTGWFVEAEEMNWFADRRVATKIITAAAVGLVLAIVLGAVALLRLGDLQRYQRQEVGHSVPYIPGLESAALAAKAAATDERGFLMAGDPKFRTEFEGRQPVADKAFQQAHDAAPGAQEAARVDGLKTRVDAWFTAVRAELAQFNQSVSGLADAVQRAASGVGEVNRAAEELATTSSNLQRVVGRFRY